MNLEYYATVAEISGGIAILISLVYVGYQIRQSNRFAKAENMRTLLDVSFMDNYNFATIAKGLNDFNSLTIDEKQEFHRYMWRLFGQYRMVLDTNKQGLVDKQLVNDWTAAIAQMMVTQGGKQWWDGGGSTATSPEGKQIIETYIDANTNSILPYTEVVKWIGSVN